MKKIIILFVLTISTSLYSQSNCDDIWLTVKNNPSNSIVVNWHTHVSGNSVVEYGLTTVLGSSVSISETVQDHHVELTGLSSGTKYYYKARTDGVDTSYIRFFTTDDWDNNLTLLVLGDTQHGDTLGVTVDSILARGHDNVDLIIHVGDLVHTGDDTTLWQNSFFNKIDTLAGYIPLMPCVGNHEFEETDDSVSNYMNYFELPSNGYKDWWYSFDYKNIHFTSLCRAAAYHRLRMVGNHRDDQSSFMISDLENSKKDWKIVYFHIPTYSSNQWDLNSDEQNERLDSLFDIRGVQVVLNGHMHWHERCQYNRVMYINVGHSAHYSHSISSHGISDYQYRVWGSCIDDKKDGGKGYNIIEIHRDYLINKAYDWSGPAWIDSVMIKRRDDLTISGDAKL